MKIACPSCSAKYSIADEKVQNRLAKIRCRKCSTTIVIDGKANPPTVQAAGAGASKAPAVSHLPASSQLPSVSGSVYTVDIAENDQRQMSVAELVEAYNTGTITADTYVWQDGMADWAPLAEVPEINDALHAAAQAASAPPPAQDPVAAVAPAFPDSMPPEPEAARAASHADARADLFGGFDQAGSETDSAAAGGGETANVTTANTGARNESSVLFSLSALTGSDQKASAPMAVPGGHAPASPTMDDSGLIDLAALTAAAEAGDPAQSVELGSAPLGTSPLGAAPLTGGTTSPLGAAPTVPPPSNKTGLFIGGGIAFAALVGGLVFVLKEEPPAPAPVAAPTTTIVVTATVAAPPAPTPSATAEEAEEEKEKKPTPTKSRYQRPKTTSKSTKSTSDSDKSPTPTKSEDKPADKPKPAPKKSKCNCKPDDLMCAMKCSAKG